tara:strand:+ start:2867 stop:4195 length:1329 start_codon:yes stop_codon:yes gene_type:complete
MHIVLILVFLTGIYGQSNKIIPCQDVVSLQSDTTYWYGLGSVPLSKSRKNKSFEAAKKIALGDLSSKINIKIQSSSNVIRSSDLKNNKEKISREFSSNVSTSTSIQINDYEIVSQGKCDSQYYILIRLNKDSFINKERSSLISSLAEFDSLDSNDFAVLFDYLSYINELYKKLDSNYFGLIDSSYQGKVSFAKNELKNKYMKSLSSIRPKYSYTLPYSIYENRPNNLKISFFSNSAKLNIVNSSADIKFFQNTNRYFFNSMGEILIPINLEIKNSSFVAMSITLNYNSVISSQYIFQDINLDNPKFSFTIKPEPLVINFEHNFENSEIESAILKTFNSILINSISVQLKNNDDAIFSLKVEALDYEKKMNTYTGRNIFIHLLDDVSISLFDNLNGYSLFRYDIGSVKGLSYIGYDEALDKLKKDLKEEGKVISEKIKNNLIL